MILADRLHYKQPEAESDLDEKVNRGSARWLRLAVVGFPLLSLLVLPQSVRADGSKLRQYAMYAQPEMTEERCALYERYMKEGKPPKKISGRVEDYGCSVSIGREAYEARFRFCFLSGVNLHQAANIDGYECFIQQRESNYIFLSHIPSMAEPKSQLICYFSCISN